ncbi:hypothetical protein D3C72_1685360 [compost metagenome]
MGELQARHGGAQAFAVAALECRTGEHEAFSRGLRGLHLDNQRIQPVNPVVVGESSAGAHPLDVSLGMEMVGFDMPPGKFAGHGLADFALAGAADAHDHQGTACRGNGGGRIDCLHGFSRAPMRWGRLLFESMLALTNMFDKPPPDN